MTHSPEILLSALLKAAPRPTCEAPRDARGLYGLVDHEGNLRYIGSTASANETLYKRIHQRHRTGSENSSHYFARMYNTGRMWRDRDDATTKGDGSIAKALRNAFIAEYCRAVWVPLPDHLDIAGLESAILAIAPKTAIAWNRRGMEVYDEPVALVDATITHLGLGAHELAALERQSVRFMGRATPTSASPDIKTAEANTPLLPSGPFRFFALDVETANNDRASICQIGVACVRADNSIETWVSYIDPKTSDWSCSRIHGITARTVSGAPTFDQVLPMLDRTLAGRVVFQHSGFDRSAISAACALNGLSIPPWNWRDSVQVAREAWPELKGNGGHGLASLKRHLSLEFTHHDAGEDARASAEIVLLAGVPLTGAHAMRPEVEEDFDFIEELSEETVLHPAVPLPPASENNVFTGTDLRNLGTSQITQGNIDNNHIYLRSFFEKFPADAVGGSNKAKSAAREISLDWGGVAPLITDLDGSKKFFRKRSWIREFFERNGAKAGDKVSVDEIAPYSYRITLVRN